MCEYQVDKNDKYMKKGRGNKYSLQEAGVDRNCQANKDVKAKATFLS